MTQLIWNGIFVGSFYALVALGYSMVYGIIKLLNFAHGDIYMVGAFAGFAMIGLLAKRVRRSDAAWCCSSSWSWRCC